MHLTVRQAPGEPEHREGEKKIAPTASEVRVQGITKVPKRVGGRRRRGGQGTSMDEVRMEYEQKCRNSPTREREEQEENDRRRTKRESGRKQTE